jgi:hypothetical protein
LKHARRSSGRPSPPEADPDATAGPQDPVCLGDSRLATSPDPVDRGHGVEAVVVPRQVEHRPQANVCIRVAGSRQLDESLCGIDPRHPCAAGPRVPEREARPAGDVEKARTVGHVQALEDRLGGVRRVVLEEASPVECPPSPGRAGLLPAVSFGQPACGGFIAAARLSCRRQISQVATVTP